MNDFIEHVKTRIQCLKEGSLAVALPRLEGLPARLEPLTWKDVERPESLALLAQWRQAAMDAFPTQFPVTLRGTRAWLREQVLQVADRLLFWVADEAGNRYGHLGLARFDFLGRQAEVDNVIRGLPGLPGVMTAAVRSLVSWSRQELGLRGLSLRVFADNQRAIRLYERCGFLPSSQIPLTCLHDGPVRRWIEANTDTLPGRFFLTMRTAA